MKALKAIGTVLQDHSVVLQLPGDIAPGEHAFIVVVEDIPAPASPEDSQTKSGAGWPESFLAQFAGSLADSDLIEPDDLTPEQMACRVPGKAPEYVKGARRPLDLNRV